MPIAYHGRTRWVLAAFVAFTLAPFASAQDDRTAALDAAFPSIEDATFHVDADVPLFLTGDLGAVASPEGFFRDHADAFGFADAPEVEVTRSETDALGLTHVRVQQTVGGVPVFGAESALHLRDGRAYAWGGDLHPGAARVRTTPVLDETASIQAAQRELGPVEYRRASGDDPLTAREDAPDWGPEARLVVLPHEGDYVLAYHVRLFVDAPTPANWEVFVDAASGELVHRFNSIHTFDPRAEAGEPAASFAPFAHETGLDADAFDRQCQHLMVIERASGAVVGTYRMQTAASARAGHGWYTAGEFELDGLPPERLETAAELGRALPRIARAVRKVSGADDYNLLQNNGAPAHQAVFHVHFHVIPKQGDGSGLGVGWQPGALEDGEGLAAAIRGELETDGGAA